MRLTTVSAFSTLVAFLLAAPQTWAGQGAPVYVTAYGGTALNNSIEQLPWPFDWRAYDSKLAGIGISRELARSADGSLGFETEAMAMRHWGDQRLWEAVALGMVRWHNLPWNTHLNSTLGAGAGVSHVSKISVIEQARNAKQARTIGYLGFEATAAPKSAEDWQGVLRWHHRSGGYGTFNGVKGGSNYLLLGVRRTF